MNERAVGAIIDDPITDLEMEISKLQTVHQVLAYSGSEALESFTPKAFEGLGMIVGDIAERLNVILDKLTEDVMDRKEAQA